MKDDFERNLEKYAEVIVKVGLNLQPDQRLIISTLLEAYPLIRKVTQAAYLAGAKFVGVVWSDEELDRIRVQHAALETMNEYANWKTDAVIEYINNGDAVLAARMQYPDLMDGLHLEKVKAYQKNCAEQEYKRRSKLAACETNWSVAGSPTISWATKVFPDSAPEEAVSQLWDAIFTMCRINQDDPVNGWQRHIAELGQRAAHLNHKQYTALRYTAPGTDLTVGLPSGHVWHSGSLTAQNGIEFVANIPTEEVFTMPHKGRIDGVVTSTKPLSYHGRLITNFRLEFSAGRVVNATAESGQETLDNLLNMDPASRSLGEVALVPHSSPISQSNILFYKTLFDENASSHLALGRAYRFTMAGGETMTAEEFAAVGGNDSMIHVDFMIGSDQMDVDGIIGKGTVDPVMRGGEWAFEA